MTERPKNEDLPPADGTATGEAIAESSKTILDCWKEYSAGVEASDKTPEALKGLWDKYIATLKQTPRTISDCTEEYRAAVEALGSAADLPDAKSGLWKTYMTLVKDFSMTPENLAGAGWTVPEKGDCLSLYCSGPVPTIKYDVIPALPSSSRISRPDFVSPVLTCDKIARFVDNRVGVQIPNLWAKTSKGSNVLTVRVNDYFPSSHPLDITEGDSGEVIAEKVQLAVRRGLAAALDQIKTLEERHEEGTAEPGSYRLAFNLAEVNKDDDSMKYMRDRGNPHAETGK